MSSNDIAIRVTNLSKRYELYNRPRDRLKQFILPRLQGSIGRPIKQYFDEFWALRDVSFEIKKGESVGIIGRNGSGKSTLLQIICGTLSPTAGSIQTYGRIAALLELGSGFNPEFTGRENVYMNAAILGLSNKEVNERFDKIAAFADIGQFIEQPVKTYSSGMFVRLAFAVNVMSTPDIMIVDEALAVGDMAFQAKCMTALTRIQDQGATVLFVSHDIGALRSLCSKGIHLERGILKSIGSAGEVAQTYERDMRIEMNTEHVANIEVVDNSSIDSSKFSGNGALTSQNLGATASDFERRVAQFRYGDGGAKISLAELLDEGFNPLSTVNFNQLVYIRVHFEALIDAEIGCNYYVLDEKKNLILGAGLNLLGLPYIQIKRGGKYIVTFKTRFPLHEGNHSVQLQLVKPTAQENTAIFLDVIDDAVVFKMSRREAARIWARVFVENEVEIQSC